MSNNYYEILGLSNDASKDDIKKAYRSLSMKWHPDRNNNNAESSEMFKKINEANEVLSDDSKKRQYDMQLNGFPGIQTFSFGFPGGFPGGAFHGNVEEFEIHNVDEIFNNLFSGFGIPTGSQPDMNIFSGNVANNIFKSLQKPPAIIKNLYLTMEEIYYGGTFNVEIERWSIINNKKIFETVNLDVVVPPGLSDNDIIQLKDKGNQISSRQVGVIKICINTKDHEYFSRHGLDLIYKKTITLKEALCGFSFEINHLNKRTILFNNNNGNNILIQPGYKKVINQLGFKKENHSGNLIIVFDVKFPEKLEKKQIEELNNIL